MSFPTRIAAALSMTCCLFGPSARGATVSQLSGPGDFTSAAQVLVDFESDAFNSPPIAFDPTAQRITSDLASGGVTTSGIWGLLSTNVGPNAFPLNAAFSVDVGEVGMFFGNDDNNLIFDVHLEVFDVLGDSLGVVSVRCNSNDFVDQFIGLRSTTPFRAARISYSRPEAAALAVYIDDFTIGLPVPEPAALSMVAAAFAAAVSAARRRGRADQGGR